MRSRNELYLAAVGVLQDGRSLDLEGEHGSGRTHMLGRIGDYFTTLGWRTIRIAGLPAFSRSPFIALAVAGVVAVPDARPASVAAAVDAVVDAAAAGRTLLIVDDWDALDEHSAGVIRAAQAATGTPILSSRLIHRSRHEAFLPAGAFTTTYAMRLPGMGYAELDTALEQLLGFRVEPDSLSRVFAKSGGNVGLAAAVVDAAHRDGRLVVEGGAGRAIGSLWSPTLRHLTDTVLQPLDRASVEALEMLSILGPVSMSTAVEVVGTTLIGDLEDRSFVSVDDLGGSSVVSVRPPLLVEHFRRDALAGRRAEMLTHIDGLLAAGVAFDDDAPAARDSAVFVRLVHEQTRRRTLQAREEWRREASLATATAFLSALEADGAHGPDELVALIGEVRGLDGTERERAEWDAARLAVRAVHGGEPAEAVAELRALASGAGAESGLLLGRAAEIETSFLPIPEADPLAGVDTRPMSDAARGAVLRGRAFWLLARGRVADAEKQLARHADLDLGADPVADALTVLAHLASDRIRVAAMLSTAGLADAERERDASLIRIHSYLSVLTALLDRRLDDAERALHVSTFLGLPSPYPPLSFVGLKTIAAIVAARRGHRALMEQLLADIDAEGLSDGPFLGQSSGIAYARMAAVEDGEESAASVCFTAGDELWARGALLSAANAYLEGLQYAPTAERWRHAEPRIAQVKAPMLQREARFVETLIERDAATAVARIGELERAGRLREALHCAEVAVQAWERDPPAGLDDVRKIRDRLVAAGVLAMGSVVVRLNPREREFAELVASGLSNKLIADALVVSVRTVESQISRLLRKLGLTRRQDVKTYLLAHGE